MDASQIAARRGTRSPLVVMVLVAFAVFIFFHDGASVESDHAEFGAVAVETHSTPHADILCVLLLVGCSAAAVRSKPSKTSEKSLFRLPNPGLVWFAGLVGAGPGQPASNDFCPILA